MFKYMRRIRRRCIILTSLIVDCMFGTFVGLYECSSHRWQSTFYSEKGYAVKQDFHSSRDKTVAIICAYLRPEQVDRDRQDKRRTRA